MKMQLMLAVNDHRNGRHTGQVDQVEVEDLIYLEGPQVPCSVHWPRYLEIDDLKFNLKGYKEWVGNMCWDCATLESVHIATIVEHLRSVGWDCTEAETNLLEAFRNGQPITAKMLEDLAKGMTNENSQLTTNGGQDIAELRERLATIQHSIWSHWMEHLFSLTKVRVEDGADIIQPEDVKRWERQARTVYAELSEKEKESDRHQADKVLALFAEIAQERDKLCADNASLLDELTEER